MTTRRRPRSAAVALATALALAAGGCGGGGGGGDDDPAASVDGTTAPAGKGMAAQVASYDLQVGRAGRFLVGLLAADQSKLVSFGTAELRFAFVDDDPNQPGTEFGPPVTATFLPIPGQDIDLGAPGPRFVEGSEGIGVYAAQDVSFDKAGFWQVQATAQVDGEELTATGAFAVVEDSAIPNVGDEAPRTENPVAGAAGVDPRSLDSRAANGQFADAALHTTSVAAAIAAQKPVMVVVSTPTYCQSRFCGPITDSVAALAGRFGDRMAFVHLEVWKNFDKQEMNKSAAEWIFPPGTEDVREPWVFVVGRDGRITERLDNVASDAELEQAAQAATA